eukprot:5238799-Pyramimonas_sp.AAC.1
MEVAGWTINSRSQLLPDINPVFCLPPRSPPLLLLLLPILLLLLLTRSHLTPPPPFAPRSAPWDR